MSSDDRIRWNGLRKKRLWQRQQIVAAIRQDLYQKGFLEAETPLLVKGTCPDLHINSMQTLDGYLVTSTEYQIKRMMVGGFEKVFTLTKNFRADDQGRYHSAEFTMLEWARAGDSLHSIEEDAIRFIRQAFNALYPEQRSLQVNGKKLDIMKSPWERLTVREAFKKHLGLEDLQDFSLLPLVQACKKAALELPLHFQHDKYLVISYLFEQLQPFLGTPTPSFLQQWPAYLTTSAPIDENDPFVAQRSELYMAGIEIADGFPFLTDAKMQQKLFEEAENKREELGMSKVITDKQFINSLFQGLPEGAGMALGMDRLAMVLTNAQSLADVQAFTWDEL